MKLACEIRDGTAFARLDGALEASGCTCLTNFWALRLGDQPRLDLDLSGTEPEDGLGVATFVGLVRDSLAAGHAVLLRAAPQVVAHNLYRVGLLDHAGLTLVDTRQDEPYSG